MITGGDGDDWVQAGALRQSGAAVKEEQPPRRPSEADAVDVAGAG